MTFIATPFPRPEWLFLWTQTQLIPTLSEHRKHVSSIENVPQDDNALTHGGQEESETIFSVLSQNCFIVRRHYREGEVTAGTEVGPGTRWALGVCSDTVKREGWFVESPEKTSGWWHTWNRNQGSHFPAGVSAFEAVPIQDGFLEMADGSHIYSVTRITFCGTICPSLSFQGAGTFVTICSASDHTENCHDSSPDTSVTHLRRCLLVSPKKLTLYYIKRSVSPLSISADSNHISYRHVLQESCVFVSSKSFSLAIISAPFKEGEAEREMEHLENGEISSSVIFGKIQSSMSGNNLS